MPSRPFRLASLLAAIPCLVSPGAHATDVSADAPPMHVEDGAVRIGSRTVRLPAGDWTLVHAKDFHPALAPGVDITTAWLVLLRDGHFGMAMQLSLPVDDMKKDRRLPDNPCKAREGALRGDYSHAGAELDCLAVFGHHDLQAILQQRSPRTAKWLARRGVPRIDDGVEFTYAHREGAMLGRVAFYFPAQEFASDDEAATWASALRDTFEPLVERKVTQVDIPPLPAAPSQP